MIPLTAPTWTHILNSMEDVLKQLQGLLKQTPPCKQLLAEKSQFFLWGNMENAFMVDALGKYTQIGSTIRFRFTKMKPPGNHHNRACGCIKFRAQMNFITIGHVRFEDSKYLNILRLRIPVPPKKKQLNSFKDSNHFHDSSPTEWFGILQEN